MGIIQAKCSDLHYRDYPALGGLLLLQEHRRKAPSRAPVVERNRPRLGREHMGV